MGFYIVTLVFLFDTVFSYTFMVASQERPPKKWGDWPYSKSRLAKWLYEKGKKSLWFGSLLPIDRFRITMFRILIVLFFVSLIFLVIDLFTSFAITGLLGEITIEIISVCCFLVPIFYEFLLTIWFAIANAVSEEGNDIKKLEKIMKKRKRK